MSAFAVVILGTLFGIAMVVLQTYIIKKDFHYTTHIAFMNLDSDSWNEIYVKEQSTRCYWCKKLYESHTKNR